MELSRDFEFFLQYVLGLMVIDAKGDVIYMNRQCADFIHVDQKKSIGRPVTEVFPMSIMPRMLKGDKAFNTNFYLCEGRLSVSTQAQLRRDGEVIGVLEYDMIQGANALDEIIEHYVTSMKDEMKYYREQVRNFQNTKYSIANIIGSSKKIEDLKNQIELAATSNSTVVITGETGTGKELVAHSIHNLSSRAFGDFVKVNAAGLPEGLAESEFFGYEEGAFTGAKKGGKKGKFELADKGTLFIDEINQMSLSLQPKLLRVLQEREVDRVGSEKSVSVDARIIAATNQDLNKLVKKGNFREDLYYRLNVFPIRVPPLRERLEDIPELVEHRVTALNAELGKHILKVEDKVYDKLREYDWPGNVRELYNQVEMAMNYAKGETLRLEYFNWRADNSPIDLESLGSLEKPIEAIRNEAERKLINEVLIMFDGNKSKTADYLKIPRPLLYQKMKRLGINGK